MERGISLIDQIIEAAKAKGVSQKELATRAQTTEETLSRAKKRGSAKLDLVQSLAKAAGVEIGIVRASVFKAATRKSQRTAVSAEGFREKYRQFAWSSPNASADMVLRRVLLRPAFQTLLAASLEFGVDKVMDEWNALKVEGGPETLRAAPITDRILKNIRNGQQQATA